MKQSYTMPNVESSPIRFEMPMQPKCVNPSASEEMARARGAVFGTFFGAGFWAIGFLCWKLVA